MSHDPYSARLAAGVQALDQLQRDLGLVQQLAQVFRPAIAQRFTRVRQQGLRLGKAPLVPHLPHVPQGRLELEPLLDGEAGLVLPALDHLLLHPQRSHGTHRDYRPHRRHQRPHSPRPALRVLPASV
jgi:hypothetical protein